jgi:hypothetical protein
VAPRAEEATAFEPPTVFEIMAFVDALERCGDRYFVSLDAAARTGLVIEIQADGGVVPLPEN